MAKELKKIRLMGEALDFVITHEFDRKAKMEEAHALMKKIEAEAEQIHKAFWAKLEEFFPETEKGEWSIDLDYMDNGIVFLREKELDDDHPIKKLAQFLSAKVEE